MKAMTVVNYMNPNFVWLLPYSDINIVNNWKDLQL